MNGNASLAKVGIEVPKTKNSAPTQFSKAAKTCTGRLSLCGIAIVCHPGWMSHDQASALRIQKSESDTKYKWPCDSHKLHRRGKKQSKLHYVCKNFLSLWLRPARRRFLSLRNCTSIENHTARGTHPYPPGTFQRILDLGIQS